MKKTLALIWISLSVALLAHGQPLPYLKEPAFQAGEELSYRLRYGMISAATGTLKVEDSKIKFSSPHSFHLSARGRTSSAFSIFFTVDNRYDSYIDSRTFLPHYYTENIREGNYRRTDIVRFDHRTKTVQGNKGTFKSKSTQTFDLLSAYYFARNLDLSQVKKGQSFELTYFLNDEIATLGIEYVGVETIKTNLGTLECLKFSPEIKPGRIFKKDSRLYLWVTNDGNRIPVKAQVEILVGSVTLELTDAKGLKYALGEKAK
ncbi:hypothetical protein GCM10007415_01280 [Parapedobacter pyrenivorans]|uniref:DUF3108 domain-containing protein n=1 Tax=Parapedobacter pyrenivorans TaxID=1305674 RepID=A0A917HB67_9SPHI|nr:DUF3108 domain-containing protein [Parapedobacter pyrenivorans]GGG73655.1 hypothetical protein GCM10007415_01280 [Parapedobacter pyrenivorans]